MGFLDDIMEGAKRAGSAAFGPPGSGSLMDAATANSPIRTHARLMEIEEFARSQGYGDTRSGAAGPLQNPDFKRDYPELADEAASIQSNIAASIGTGAMNIASAAAARAPGTVGQAAAAANRPLQPGLPGMGSSQGKPFTAPPAFDPAYHLPPRTPVNPPATQLPLPPGGPQMGPPNVMGPLQGPAQMGPQHGPPNVMGPIQGPAPLGPINGPPNITGPVLGPAVPPPPPGMLTNAVNAVKNHPIVAGAGALVTGIPIGVSIAASQARAASPPRPDGPTYGPDPQEADLEAQRIEKEKKDAAEAERIRANKAQTDLVANQAAYADAQRKELERRMANADMTDTEKEAARAELNTKIAELNNSGANARTATEQAGANQRTATTEAGANQRTATTEAGANERTRITEAGANQRTATTEAGANTRAGYEGQVAQRGQDVTDRGNRLNYVVQQAANEVARGTLSITKAHNMIADYMAREKLPSEILNNVSMAMERVFPYMRNGNPGDTAPGYEKGGPNDELYKMAGLKPPKSAGYSDFDFEKFAAKYGGGAPTTPSKPIDIEGMYASAPDLSDAAMAAKAQRDFDASGAGMTPQVAMPASMQATQPMGPEAEQRILNGIK